MNQSIIKNQLELFDHSNLNFLDRITNLKPKDGYSTLVTSTILENQLRKINYRWPLRQKLLAMARLSKGQFCRQLFRSIASLNRHISHLIMWDCKVDLDFLIQLSKAEWVFQYIMLIKCFEDSKVLRSLSLLNLSKIRYFALFSSPIRNKEISFLLSNSMPELHQLHLENLSITNDIINIIEKKKDLYTLLSINLQSNFNDLSFSSHLYRNIKIMKTRDFNISQESNLLYLPYYVKLKMDQEYQHISFRFDMNEYLRTKELRKQRLKYTRCYSRHTHEIMNRKIYFYNSQ